MSFRAFLPLLLAPFAIAIGASTACFPLLDGCVDEALHRGECERSSGSWHHDACRCEGVRSRPTPSSSSTSSPAPYVGRCDDDADCAGKHCVYGWCSSASCEGDLDCRAEAECSLGSCRIPCRADAGACPDGFVCLASFCRAVTDDPDALELGSCDADAECRADAGAICRRGRCYGAP